MCHLRRPWGEAGCSAEKKTQRKKGSKNDKAKKLIEARALLRGLVLSFSKGKRRDEGITTTGKKEESQKKRKKETNRRNKFPRKTGQGQTEQERQRKMV